MNTRSRDFSINPNPTNFNNTQSQQYFIQGSLTNRINKSKEFQVKFRNCSRKRPYKDTKDNKENICTKELKTARVNTTNERKPLGMISKNINEMEDGIEPKKLCKLSPRVIPFNLYMDNKTPEYNTRSRSENSKKQNSNVVMIFYIIG